MKDKSTPVLCYVRGDRAFFTTRALDEQWGDDWNDAPYEHNAGTPYRWDENSDGRWCRCRDPLGSFCWHGNGACGKPGHVERPPKQRWDIIEIAFTGDFNQPCDTAANSSFSVEQINNLGVPWLQNDKIEIFAGTHLGEFMELIRIGGGDLLFEEAAQDGAD